MSIIKQITTIAAAPVLLCYQDSIQECGKHGTILFYHGFTCRKESQEGQLNDLAQAGFLVVSVDNVGHGERLNPNFAQMFGEERWTTEPEGAFTDYLQMVRETIQEVPTIIDELLKRGWAQPDRLGIAGVSMGGSITYGAIVVDPRLRVATPMIGTPDWRVPSPDSPHLHPDRFFPVALLSQNATEDETVPPYFARTFHEQLIPFYTNAPERLCYIEYPNVGHFLSSEAWKACDQKMIAWFQRWLAPHI